MLKNPVSFYICQSLCYRLVYCINWQTAGSSIKMELLEILSVDLVPKNLKLWKAWFMKHLDKRGVLCVVKAMVVIQESLKKWWSSQIRMVAMTSLLRNFMLEWELPQARLLIIQKDRTLPKSMSTVQVPTCHLEKFSEAALSFASLLQPLRLCSHRWCRPNVQDLQTWA